MKTFLVNLLIILSVALCGFNAYQWYREAKLHGRINNLGTQIFQKSSEIQNLQQSLKSTQEEIKRLEEMREVYATTIRSNRVVIGQLEVESRKFQEDAQLQAAKVAQLEQYKVAFEAANENLIKQNEIIKTQNDRMVQLAEDRNEMVGRFNKLATDYKSLGDDYHKVLDMYTNLVAQVQAANARGGR